MAPDGVGPLPRYLTQDLFDVMAICYAMLRVVPKPELVKKVSDTVDGYKRAYLDEDFDRLHVDLSSACQEVGRHMFDVMRLPVVGLCLLFLFLNQAFADGVLFTCTGTKGYGISAPEKRYVAKSKTPDQVTLRPINEASRTVKLWVRSNDQWDISVHWRDVNVFYSKSGCIVELPQQPIHTLHMLFTVACEYSSETFLFLDQDNGTRLIATQLSAPNPTLNGILNEGGASVYTAECRKGE